MSNYVLEFSDGLKIIGKSHHIIRLFHPAWTNGNLGDFNLCQLMAIAGTYNDIPITTKISDCELQFQPGVFSLSESALERKTQTLIKVTRHSITADEADATQG